MGRGDFSAQKEASTYPKSFWEIWQNLARRVFYYCLECLPSSEEEKCRMKIYGSGISETEGQVLTGIEMRRTVWTKMMK
jgi:hypothetical protein